MTATFNASIRQRVWRGYDDPGLPTGMYFGQGAVTGDASGGQMRVIFEFRDAGSRSGRFFNIEQLDAQHTDAVNKNFHVGAVNWERVGDSGLLNRQWRGRVVTNSNGLATTFNTEQVPLPLFLGQTTVVTELASTINVTVDNVDLSSWGVTIQGYIWGPRSTLSEGGLRRPIDSLYGGGRGA